MKSEKLLTPQFRIFMGDYVFSEGVKVECVSSKAPVSDWCKLELATQFKEIFQADTSEPVSVELGYDEHYSVLITGYDTSEAGYWKERLIKDEMIRLEQQIIKAAFVDCTPQDVVKYVLSCAGITDFLITEELYEKKMVFSVDAKNGIQVLTEVNAAWGIKQSFFFQNQVFYWGTHPVQEVMYVLEEQNNILSIKKYNELWEVETLGIPWIHHSQQVEVIHTKFSGIVEVYKTIIKSDEDGFVRMFIYFRED